jgi:hypothetical protein
VSILAFLLVDVLESNFGKPLEREIYKFLRAPPTEVILPESANMSSRNVKVYY